jgi:hypothetical protein
MHLKDTDSNKTEKKHEPTEYEVNARVHACKHKNTIVQRSFNPFTLSLGIRLWSAKYDRSMLLYLWDDTVSNTRFILRQTEWDKTIMNYES